MMIQRKRVLHVLNTGRFSGAENVVCQIIGMFRDDPGFEMAYTSPDGQIRQALAEREIRFFPMKRLDKKELARVISQFEPDIIHAHDVRAAVLTSPYHKKAKLVSTMHVNDISMRRLRPKAALYCAAARRFGHIFWVSQSSLDGYFFRKQVATKSSVLMNIMDIDDLGKRVRADTAEYHFDVVYLGRISAQKDPKRLADVLALSLAQKPDLRAAIVGTGEMEDEMKAYVRTLDIESNVTFLGFQSNPLKILHDAKVMIMTSVFEGTPMCALEAMALGVPIVSTPTDGMCELVLDGRTGFLSADNKVLAARLVQILTETGLHDALSRAAASRFSELSDIQAYKNRLLEAYTG